MQKLSASTQTGTNRERGGVVASFVRTQRRQLGLTQAELARKAGVGLRFLRELERGKQSLRIDTVNKVLSLFGKRLGPVEMTRE